MEKIENKIIQNTEFGLVDEEIDLFNNELQQNT